MNQIFRRMIPLILALLCCTACTNTKDAVPTDPSPLVTDVYSTELTYIGNIYNEQTGNYEDTSIIASYHIPKINLPGDAISEINTELYDALYPDIQNSASEIEEYGYPRSDGISYHWAENGDILSLVTENRRIPEYGCSEYFVYNISISSGAVLSNKNIITDAGFSEKEYYELAEQVLGSFYWYGFDTSDENFEKSNFVDFFNEALQKTISQDNIDQSFPYINEQGQLCIVAKIYSVAGADYYWNDLNMIDFELNPNYNKSVSFNAESGKELSLFSSMPQHFVFSSGAGGWGTYIDLKKDGSFVGQYHDSDMGATGPSYSHGTVRICNFSGKFSIPEKIADNTYSMRLEYLDVDGTPGEIYYEDDFKYIYSEPYGLENAEEFLIYSPGIRIADLPQEFVNWLRGFMNVQTIETLPVYGIYNVKAEDGFVASN